MEPTKTIEPPHLLPLQQPERFARHQEVAGRQDVHVLLPEREGGVLDRRGRGDAGIGDHDVDAAEGQRGGVEARNDISLVGDVELDADRAVAAELPDQRFDPLIKRCLVDVGEDDAGAFAQQP